MRKRDYYYIIDARKRNGCYFRVRFFFLAWIIATIARYGITIDFGPGYRKIDKGSFIDFGKVGSF